MLRTFSETYSRPGISLIPALFNSGGRDSTLLRRGGHVKHGVRAHTRMSNIYAREGKVVRWVSLVVANIEQARSTVPPDH